jgi:pyruvate formate lyase activating enzyme
LRLIGKRYTAEELLAEIRKDYAFYEASGGGITLSGGEPTFQALFLSDFLPLCKDAGLHTAIETCGYVPYEKLEMLLPYLDLVLYDLKAVDPSLHRQLTGRDNALILANLRHLIEISTPLIIRMPLIPTLTAIPENLKEVIHFLKENGVKEIYLLPYHPLGESKLEAIDSPLRPLGLSCLSEEKLAKMIALFEREGVEARIGG